ncbi:hypothetical protein DAPPUDRAFT_236857 [Daphnia pulex]|uniref:Uncharacterized protein n=1 Tax=Daphnia pulex TaxID=6669 RepID=E9G239_DAPPU|nr:hypothetical protein DAPPUDRAFT_236857 [Daphnia pulex]|eukprot:EFX86179.1 hypothetical protein DAPPUDRAFT_236857 [Daphnia pulex]
MTLHYRLQRFSYDCEQYCMITSFPAPPSFCAVFNPTVADSLFSQACFPSANQYYYAMQAGRQTRRHHITAPASNELI